MTAQLDEARRALRSEQNSNNRAGRSLAQARVDYLEAKEALEELPIVADLGTLRAALTAPRADPVLVALARVLIRQLEREIAAEEEKVAQLEATLRQLAGTAASTLDRQSAHSNRSQGSGGLPPGYKPPTALELARARG